MPWYRHANDLLDKLRSNENSPPFLYPVDTTIYTDYYAVIREPMDLSKISKRLRSGHYIIPNDIIRDIHLILSNAKTYNAKGTMVYKMTTELQSFFETLVLDFLKSCGGEASEPLHATRHTLGQLAHSLSTDDVPMATTPTPIEASPRQRRSCRQRRTRSDLSRPQTDSDSDSLMSERSSVAVSTPLTPASESSVLTVQSSLVGAAGTRGDPPNQSHRMTLRDRNPVKPVKRVLEDSGEEEEEEGGRRAPIRTRSWGNPYKRQRLSSDSDADEASREGAAVTTVTRTSRGRLVKPIQKFN